MNYIGEHAAAGNLGNFFVILAFVSSLLAAVSYFLAENKKDEGWKTLGRISFLAHGVGILGIVITLFYMIFNQYFEYHYVWQHSSSELPLRYIFSCFWEGQEGSFLLWSFWHLIIGLVLMKKGGRWEAPVLAVFAIVQAFILSMILGVYILDYKVGSNPFTVLLREHPDFANIPLFSNPNYLEQLDGRGLNPLLQNYWMTIHPPTLFLGFASTLTPFAFAIAGLWTKEYKAWIKPALPWTYFSILILGTGILMGGAWAYEALSFGGFWAWDPVENASLVPWLTIVGAGHLMIVEEKRGGVMKSLLFLTLISFILVLYSTFLTRSGILGDASVHAFTDLGMSGQLLIYLFSFMALGIGLVLYRFKALPSKKEEEDLWSREFWMFVGTLVLFLSSLQITFSTSLPVINKVFGTQMAPPSDAIEHYNSWQIPFAIFILLLIGFGQFLNYKNTSFKKFFNRILTSIIVSFVVSFTAGLAMGMQNPFHLFLFFASAFAVFANLDYWLRVLKGKMKFSGASIAHAGFGLMLLGALISMGQQNNISTNSTGVDLRQLDSSFQNQEHILLMKNDTLPMGDYMVTYSGREQEGINIRFLVHYFSKDNSGKLNEEFTLKPRVQLNDRMGNVPEPDTRHFLGKDIYTHVTWAQLKAPDEERSYEEPRLETVKAGDTLFLKRSIMMVDSLKKVPSSKHGLKESDIAVEVALTLWDFNTDRHVLEPVFVLADTVRTYSIPAESEELGLSVSFENIHPEDGSIDLVILEEKSKKQDFIVMKAIEFPFINLLWMGCLIMILGTGMAIWRRIF